MLSTVCGPERNVAIEAGTSRQGEGQQKEPTDHHQRRLATRATTVAPLAAGLMVVVCVVARLPDRLIGVTGLRGWAPALVGVVAMVNAARMLAQAPFTFARRETSASRWAADQAKALVAAVVVGAALTVALYALIRATEWWWLWAWALFAVVTVVAQAAMPFIVRIQTGPLSPARPPLAQQVDAIATRAGADLAGGVLIADKSTGKGPRCNAYVVGSGATRRVVLETGVAGWPAELLDQVVAHEIGHWRLRHGARRLPITLGAQLATFGAAAAVLSWRPLLDVAGVTSLGDPRSYALVLALTAALALPARLVLAGYDRRQERQADQFALRLLGDPAHFEAMLDRAASEGDAPRQLPWWRYCTASHPPIDERIALVQEVSS